MVVSTIIAAIGGLALGKLAGDKMDAQAAREKKEKEEMQEQIDRLSKEVEELKKEKQSVFECSKE